jgi:hypothetical protein
MRFTIWLGVVAYISRFPEAADMPWTMILVLAVTAVVCAIQDSKELFK